MIKKLRLGVLLLLALISLIMHFNHFPKDLMGQHVWRQAQTQANIINFYEEDFNILNPRRDARGNTDGIFRMEFPLMQWIVAGLYKIFGNHIIITRLSMFIIGLLSVIGMYSLLNNIFQNQIIALMGAWAFNFSPDFYYYTINPIPDNLALCCSLWGMSYFFLYMRRNNIANILFSSIFLSIGTMCKLPFVVYFSVPLIFFLLKYIRPRTKKSTLYHSLIMIFIFVLSLSWYLMVIPSWHGNGVLKGIFDNRIPFLLALDYIQGNLFSILPELLLNYGSVLFFLAGFYFLVKRERYKHEYFLPLLAFSLSLVSYFLFELNMISTIHDYYLFPFYPVLFILVSYGAYNLYCLKPKFFKYLTIILLIILPFTAYIRMQGRWTPDNPGFNKDLLIYKDNLRSSVPDNALCIVGNDESPAVFLYYVHKKGWGFHHDNLTGKKLSEMIQKGAQFLFSDSRAVEKRSDIKPFLEELISSHGSIRIYKLSQVNAYSMKSDY
jgi:hypothetical protein